MAATPEPAAPEPAAEADGFHTRTDPRQLTFAQVAVGITAVGTALAVVLSLVWLPFAVNPADPVILGIGSALLVPFLVWGFRVVRRRQYTELTVDPGGITLVTDARARRVRRWTWPAIHALAVAEGGVDGRQLVVEDGAAAASEQRRPAASRVHRRLTGWHPLATLVPLRYLRADQHETVEAIRRYSGGRFPGPDRRSPYRT